MAYCSNTACPNSGQVASKLEALGYTNVRKYAEGIQDWVEAGLPVGLQIVGRRRQETAVLRAAAAFEAAAAWADRRPPIVADAVAKQ